MWAFSIAMASNIINIGELFRCSTSKESNRQRMEGRHLDAVDINSHQCDKADFIRWLGAVVEGKIVGLHHNL